MKASICLRLLTLSIGNTHLPEAFERLKRETGFCLRLSDPTAASNNFSEGFPAIQKGTTQSGRLRFTDKFGERKPKAGLHLSVFGRKALGCESPIKSRIACGGQQAETLSWRLIVRVFRSKNFPVGRLCESFTPQTSRWGDCASLSLQNHLVGAIVRVFRTTDFSMG